MKQVAKELTNFQDGFLNGKRYLIMDRDTRFCSEFREILQGEQIEPVRLPPRSPNLNAHLERFFGSLKGEILDRMIFFGERSLRRAVKSYLEHYHRERPHQGLGNVMIEPRDESIQHNASLQVQCSKRLGGMLRYYHRTAA